MNRLRIAIVLLAFAVVLWLAIGRTQKTSYFAHGPANDGKTRTSIIRLKEIEKDLVSKNISLSDAAKQASLILLFDEGLSQMLDVAVGETIEHKTAHLMMEWVESHPDRHDFLKQYRDMTGFTYKHRTDYHK